MANPSFVRNIGTASGNSVSTLTITVPAAGVAAGDFIGVWVFNGNQTSNPSVTDDAGNTYTRDITLALAVGGLSFFRVLSALALTSGQHITVTVSASAPVAAASAVEFSPGAGNTLALDVRSGSGTCGSGSSTAPTAVSPTVGGTSELVLSGVTFYSTTLAGTTETMTQAGSFLDTGDVQIRGTGGSTNTRGGIFPQYQTPASVSGTYTGGGTLGHSESWQCFVATYLATAAAVDDGITLMHTEPPNARSGQATYLRLHHRERPERIHRRASGLYVVERDWRAVARGVLRRAA